MAIGGEHDTVEGLLAAVFRTVLKERALHAVEGRKRARAEDVPPDAITGWRTIEGSFKTLAGVSVW